ncbi:nucleotidyltransferase domain-containing protein [Hydrogenophaga sp. BPS33]|uniref:nucleotidyltransferase domain-containing protein n=1 Tax=Hydrogenophaga sp. BPS33 TaxID=2651974 RepID=UPI00131FC1F0|nr:nucleotidyltransferase domain-containing protein [Hydrogenophaga sp. BPS33]QHE85370.1 transcriptional regulator [Hydrogenophaga sp. BPS33]
MTSQTSISSKTADALFPKVRQRVLAVLFGTPDRSYYANELIDLAQSGKGAVQRELAGLCDAGLITSRKQGNQKHYQANPDSAVYTEIRGLVLKTMGLADVLHSALMPIAPQIRQAFVYGSMARQEDTASSDVDLMIVSPSLGYGDVFATLEGAQSTLARSVNPTIYTPEEFERRVAEDNAFVTRVMEQPKIWLIEAKKQDHDKGT